ncbi:MAG TPA: nickel pincer cofactor biosynthesis protein LarC [Polyangiaceae bacterium]|nr:nickel pincer cofactor biosynthesis protein LarC [Polyangiaceae bacterium]
MSGGFVPSSSGGDGANESGVDGARGPLVRGAGSVRWLFLDCQSGISGDMTLGALLDLGVPLDEVRRGIAALGLPGVEVELQKGHVGVLGASRFVVRESHQADATSYAAIRERIESSSLQDAEKSLAQRIFLRLAEAEAEVHRMELEHVQFHEVGAVDSIVDIVGAAIAFVYLGARVIASPVPLGRGYVQSQHGVLPLPAPATLLCLRGVPTRPSGLEVELVTPTGAAILSTVAEEYSEWPSLRVERIGSGAGTRVLPDRPNMLRAILGEAPLDSYQRGALRAGESDHAAPGSGGLSGPRRVNLALLETNVDDMTGEQAAHALEQLIAEGALDAWFAPITMKKGRPALALGVLGPLERAQALTDVLFAQTSTIGVRQSIVPRVELPRRQLELDTPDGKVRAKLSQLPSGERMKLEYEDCARIARAQGRPLAEVTSELEARFRQALASGDPALKGARA